MLYCTILGPVLIIGDSIVRWAGGGHLHVPMAVEWLGRSGAHICDIPSMLAARRGPEPIMLLLHIGTNDLVDVDEFCLRQRILTLIQSCTALYPNAILIWSCILPRVFYFGARSQAALEKKRRAVNRWAKKQCTKIGGHYLPHLSLSGATRHYIGLMGFTFRRREIRYFGIICGIASSLSFKH